MADYLVPATKFEVIKRAVAPTETLEEFLTKIKIPDVDRKNCLIIAASSINVLDETYGSIVSSKKVDLRAELSSSTDNLIYQSARTQAVASNIARLVPMLSQTVAQYVISSNGILPKQVVYVRSQYDSDWFASFLTEIGAIRFVLGHMCGLWKLPVPGVIFLYLDEPAGFQGPRSIFRLVEPCILDKNGGRDWDNQLPLFDFLDEVDAKRLPAIILENLSATYESVLKSV